MTAPRERRDPDAAPYTLYYEDARGALLFDEQSSYVLYAERDGGVHVVDSGTDVAELRALLAGKTPGDRAGRQRRRVGPRPGLRSRRRSGLAAAVSAAMTGGLLLAPGIGTAPAAGADRPTKVLQAVDIELGADGAIRSVSRTDVRKTDGETATDTARLDPPKVAGDLPVRVLTSYVHDGRTGTNLADLKGVRGRVELTITVENTTARTEKLQYDVRSRPQERYALTAVPLTVTAAAVLPKDSFAKVVLPSHNAAATNGVVGRTDSGDTTVQWAAMLAPPQLGSSASFTLVEDATDFRVPELDLTVQPGLVTDPSVERLLHEAFRKTGSNQLSLENKSIVLITKVNRILGQATGTLTEVRDALADGADELGSQLIHQLAASSGDLATAAGGLSSSLDELHSGLTASLEQSRDDNVAMLRETVAALSEYIGHPDDLRPEPLPVSSGCAISVAGAKKATTLYAQLKRVSQQLRTLEAATSGCTDTIKRALDATLGNPEDCAAGDDSISCTLVATRRQLTDVAAHLATAGKDIVDRFKPQYVENVGDALTVLTKEVAALQTAAGKLGNGAGGNDADDIATQLAAVATDLDGLITSVTPGGPGLAASLAALHAEATARAGVIGGEDGAASSISGQVQAAATAACDTPSVMLPSDEDVTAYVKRLRAILVGTGCGNGPAAVLSPDPQYPTPLSTRLTIEHQAWVKVAAMTDLDASKPTGAAAELKALRGDLLALKATIQAVAADAGGPGDGLSKKVEEVVTRVKALYGTSEAAPACPPAPDTPPAVKPLNVLAVAFGNLECNQRGLGDDVKKLLVTATPTYAAAADAVDVAADASNAARLKAASDLDGLLGTLNGSLADAAEQSLAEGGAVISAQQDAMATRRDAVVERLDDETRRAVAGIGTRITESNRLLADSTNLLKAGLRNVQLDLGSPGNGTGLLGEVSAAANGTGAAGLRVGDATSRAAAFRHARSAELDDVLLEEAQLTRAFQLHAEYPPFALTLPPGSTSSVVFNFHLQGA